MAQSFLLAPGTSAEDLAARRRLAMNLQQKGSSDAPVGHWLQGANRAVQGLMGGWEQYNLEQSQKAERDEANKLLGEVFGTSGVPDSGAPQTSSAAPQHAPSASAQGGGSRSLADRIIGVESGGDPAATNPRSSATGSGQFINSTWLDMVKRNRPDLAAGKSDEELLALRTDPELSRQMVDASAAENAVTLDRAGYEPTDANTYLAHFAGPAGAKAVLGADPNAPAASVLGEEAVAANPFLADMTAGDLVGWAQRKMGGGQAPTGGPAAAPAARPTVDPNQPRPVATTTIDPATGNPMPAAPQAGPQAGQPSAPAQNNALGIDQNTAQLIQKLAGNRHTAPLANQLLTAAMKPKSPKDRFVVADGQLYDTVSGQWMSPPSKSGFKVVGKGGQVFDESTGQFITPEGGGVADPIEGAEFEQKLRKEFAALSKDYKSIQEGADRVRVGAKLDNGVGDLSLIFGYMKLLDPGSVVREGEFANAENAQGVPDRIRNVWNKIVSGDRLNPRSRQEFVNAATALAKEQQERQQRVIEQFRKISTDAGVDPARVIMDFGPRQETPPPPDAAGAQIPQQAIDLLKSDPSPEAVREFDEVFGQGAAQRIFGR